MYWTTREGKKLKISDMATSHIINCLKMLERGNFDKDIYDSLLQELEKREVPYLPAYIRSSEVIKENTFEEF